MTNQQKAESCGESVDDGIGSLWGRLALIEQSTKSIGPLSSNQELAESYGAFVRDGLRYLETVAQTDRRDQIVDDARQAGHWGRLALAEIDEDEVSFQGQTSLRSERSTTSRN